jgi:hypothetical protein
MAERRPLAAPFTTSPDGDPEMIRNFVKQDRADARESNEIVEPVVERPHQTVRVVPATERQAEPRPPAESRSVPLARTKKKRMNSITPVAPVPVTVRLRPEVAGGLKRASLERQLSGEELFTQQDIVETLLEPWLKEQGYLE